MKLETELVMKVKTRKGRSVAIEWGEMDNVD